jgi:hypothetical protein
VNGVGGQDAYVASQKQACKCQWFQNTLFQSFYSKGPMEWKMIDKYEMPENLGICSSFLILFINYLNEKLACLFSSGLLCCWLITNPRLLLLIWVEIRLQRRSQPTQWLWVGWFHGRTRQNYPSLRLSHVALLQRSWHLLWRMRRQPLSLLKIQSMQPRFSSMQQG